MASASQTHQQALAGSVGAPLLSRSVHARAVGAGCAAIRGRRRRGGVETRRARPPGCGGRRWRAGADRRYHGVGVLRGLCGCGSRPRCASAGGNPRGKGGGEAVVTNVLCLTDGSVLQMYSLACALPRMRFIKKWHSTPSRRLPLVLCVRPATWFLQPSTGGKGWRPRHFPLTGSSRSILIPLAAAVRPPAVTCSVAFSASVAGPRKARCPPWPGAAVSPAGTSTRLGHWGASVTSGCTS